MNALRKATAKRMARLVHVEGDARNLLSEADSLEVRLHRASGAASVDLLVPYLNMERKRMLKEEERAETSGNLGGFAILGICGLFSLFTGRKPNWDTLVPAVFREQPFEDVRIAISEDNIRLVNVSKMAREWDMTVMDVVAYLKEKGNEVLSWPEFEARARNMRRAVLSGELVLGERQKPQALPVGGQLKWVRVSSVESTPSELFSR